MKKNDQFEKENVDSESTKNTPNNFMRARHPDLFSDTKLVTTFELPKEVFEYHLDSLTSRKQENDFEYFCRRLAEKEICPNLLPQTGPLGGGDSQVDAENYPVADKISLRWYVGIGREADSEKWAFAFSAKKAWRPKLKSDIQKIVDTKRGYKKIFFITNQFVKDKTRADLEDQLSKEINNEIHILDRSWIIKCVFEHDGIEIAVETLKIPGFTGMLTKQIGPNDLRHQNKLDELEKQISDPNRYQGVEYQLAEDCLDSALLARNLELPRVDVEGRFQRAIRVSEKVNFRKQKLQIIYNLAWTEYWWFEDYSEFNKLYDQVEELVLGSDQSEDIELLNNLWQNIFTAIRRGHITEQEGKIIQRTKTIKTEINRLASDTKRPNNALQAYTYLQFIEMTEKLSSDRNVDQILENLIDTLNKANGLAHYSINTTVMIIQELGDILTDSSKYDELLDVAIKITEKRTNEGQAGKMLLHRGLQKFDAGKYYDAIRLVGRAQKKLAMDEYKPEWITSLMLCGFAYESVGLLWAARTNILMATNLGFLEFLKDGKLRPQVLMYANRLVWIELQLGRLPQVLSWIEYTSVLSSMINIEADQKDKYFNELDLQDSVFAILFAKTSIWDLKWLDFLPDVLDQLGLGHSWMTLLYVLGYEDYLRVENVIPSDENSQSIKELFTKLLDQPANDDLPEQPIFLNNRKVRLSSPVLGCNITINLDNNQTALYLAETILGSLEAFLSTSFDSDLIPFRSDFQINLYLKDHLSGLPEYDDETLNQSVINIYHPSKFSKDNQSEQTAFHGWLQDLILKIIFNIAIITNADSYINQIVRNELSFDRALLFSDVEISITNLLGENPKFKLSDWNTENITTKFPLKREVPWNIDILNRQQNDLEKKPLKVGEGEPPDNLFDFDKIRHKDRKILSIINPPLWDKAKWIATGFLGDEEEAPILAICFENKEAANQIFKEWMEKVGVIDNNDQIRISFVTGISKNHPFYYRVTIGSNPLNFAPSKANHFILTSRINEMHAQTNIHLNYFFEQYNKLQKYILAPAQIGENSGYPEPIGNYYIGKLHLTIRPAWKIGLNDPDVVAIKEDDDPIIPEDIVDAPVIQSLHRFKKKRSHKE